MLRFLLLGLAVVFTALGALTVFRSPDWSSWKLALLAGEFGHCFAVAAFALALTAWCTRAGYATTAGVTVTLSVLAAGFFLRPTVEAWIIGETLPGELVAAFGGMAPTRAAFSAGNYFAAAPKPVAVETREFSTGLKLDFYRAVNRAAAPCVIMIHGGGWDSGDRLQLMDFNHWLARLGYAVVAIDYRLAPKSIWPAQRDDTLAAIAYVKAHAAELGVDATRLVLFGRSAGGQIASAVAYESDDPAIRGLAAFYAPHDMFFAYTYAREDDILKSPQLMRQYLGGTPAAAKANYESASGHQHVRRGSPPTLIVHGTIDTLVWYRHSVRLDGKLTAAQVPHAYVALPWATHAFEFTLTGPSSQLATYALEHFLAVVTK